MAVITRRISRRTLLSLAASAPVVGWAAKPAFAAQKLRVAKGNPHALSFVPVDVGIAEGFFPSFDIEIIDFAGAAKGMQGMVAGDADIYLGAGTDMAFVSKGVPMTAVAALAGPPLLLVIIVPFDSPIKTADDLRGKKIQVSTVGSVTEWLVKKLASVKGWGPEGITTVAMGGDLATQIAALRTHQVDAIVGTASVGYQLEEKQQGRVLIPTASYVKDFLLHAIFASNSFIASDPEAVRAFLKGWFQSIAFMRANKAETVKIAYPITGVDEGAESKEYDLVMPMFSADGKFPPASLDVIAQSFVDLKILDTKPDMSKFLTEKFLPSA
jgi:ABC-type nitrate/sulfonate/bicarbonate transport system substrate-binding protein